jgi:Family of unknown function (DUF6049)
MPKSARLASGPPFLIALALVVVAAGTPQGGARAAAQEPNGKVVLDLVGQEVWLRGPRAPLGLRLRVTNGSPEPLEGFQLTLAVGERIESRSGLYDTFETSFNDPSFLPLSSFTDQFPDRRIAAGAGATVAIDSAVERFDSLESETDGGVYPIAIYLFDESGEQIDAITTQLIYYPMVPAHRLNLVLVVPLGHVPARAPDGTFPADPLLGTRPLESALAPDGWLQGMLTALRRHPALAVGVAPTPRLIEEIADMANGYTRSSGAEGETVGPGDAQAEAAAAWLDELREVLNRSRAQPLLVPYAAPDLPSLDASLAAGSDLSAHVVEGVKVLSRAFGEDTAARFTTSWLFAPAGRLDASVLEDLQPFNLAPDRRLKTFLAPDSLRDGGDPSSDGCPRGYASFTCPVSIQTTGGSIGGFVSDEQLGERLEALGRPGEDRIDLQRLFAETAMIREEIPGVSGRVVQTATPALWEPPPGLVEELFAGLDGAPWITPMTPQRAFRASTRAARRGIVEDADRLKGEPDDGYLRSVSEAASGVHTFSLIKPSPSLLQRLTRNVLVAQSRSWWGGSSLRIRGERYATESRAEAETHLDNITIGGRAQITLTSERQPLPLVLFNDNPYPVTVEVSLSSTDLDFDTPSRLSRRIEEGNYPFEVEATALSSGQFPLTVRLYPPGGNVVIDETEIAVRSTQFNKIALGLTIGALAFLLLFYALRALRRRSSPGDSAQP